MSNKRRNGRIHYSAGNDGGATVRDICREVDRLQRERLAITRAADEVLLLCKEHNQ